MNNDNKIIDEMQPQTPVQPVSSVRGGANKEVGPISVVPELKPAGPEVKHEIHQESAALGVKEIQDRPDLTEGINMQHAGPHIPVPRGPTGLVRIPEKKDISSSGTWLNALWEKVRKMRELIGI